MNWRRYGLEKNDLIRFHHTRDRLDSKYFATSFAGFVLAKAPKRAESIDECNIYILIPRNGYPTLTFQTNEKYLYSKQIFSLRNQASQNSFSHFWDFHAGPKGVASKIITMYMENLHETGKVLTSIRAFPEEINFLLVDMVVEENCELERDIFASSGVRGFNAREMQMYQKICLNFVKRMDVLANGVGEEVDPLVNPKPMELSKGRKVNEECMRFEVRNVRSALKKRMFQSLFMLKV